MPRRANVLAMTVQLLGTVTSPYVRRVRAVAHALSLPVDLVDTFTDEGQARLRAMHPLWKVPAAKVAGQVVYDSRVIVDLLVRQHGGEVLSPIEPTDVETLNVLTVIDGALDALINVFYLTRDGVAAADGTYVAKQVDRAAAAMTWLEARVDDVWVSPHRRFGIPEIALCTAMGWMAFRDTYEIADHPALMRCFEKHDAVDCLARTRPPK